MRKNCRLRIVDCRVLLSCCLFPVAGCLLLLAGCSQFQARGDTKALILAQAQAAPVVMKDYSDGSLTPIEAIAMLQGNTKIMDDWSSTATTNWFEYAFGSKQIFCNADYKDDLSKAAVRFAGAEKRATTQPAQAPFYVNRESADFIRFKAALDGTATPAMP